MTADRPLTVIQALAEVMGDVQAIGKRDRNEQQRYMFRGVDAVMNAVGPSLRAHGIVIVPEEVVTRYADTTTTTGKATREVTVLVTYRAYGPGGDSITIQAPGESLDSGDKGTPKAMSVAYRTALLQALTIPTDEPDPDAQSYERTAPGRDDVAHVPHADPPRPMTGPTRGRMFALLTERGITDEDVQRAGMSQILGREVASRSTLTEAEARTVIHTLEASAPQPPMEES